ncbi:hypothetical protein J5N97_020915 [Dioscorea zingiberensis]|uniref:DUF4283 domain-containing protein n=1 Tax=Dioscorea zingiberensis TaxID=325984 RepID=A0A9D5CGQ0_9LILI|nr:hypothetical protein J5N97_020915 [Dioscorea zingiberensis]
MKERFMLEKTWMVKLLQDELFVVEFPTPNLAWEVEKMENIHLPGFILKLWLWLADLGALERANGEERWISTQSLPLFCWNCDIVLGSQHAWGRGRKVTLYSDETRINHGSSDVRPTNSVVDANKDANIGAFDIFDEDNDKDEVGIDSIVDKDKMAINTTTDKDKVAIHSTDSKANEDDQVASTMDTNRDNDDDVDDYPYENVEVKIDVMCVLLRLLLGLRSSEVLSNCSHILILKRKLWLFEDLSIKWWRWRNSRVFVVGHWRNCKVFG